MSLSYRNLNIEPFIVLDGMTPKFFVEEERILEKSFRVWDKAAITDDNKELNDEILRRFGVRFYQQEIVRYYKGHHF